MNAVASSWNDLLPPDRPALMGIVNVTPDSFSDGGQFLDPAAAVAHGRALIEAGADILDIGGESTRPGAAPVSPAEEADRVLPVIEGLADAGVPLSVDTRNAPVMRAAVDAGAAILNDVSALTHDRDSAAVAAETGALIILMHMKGDPADMNAAPEYGDVVAEVADYLAARAGAAIAAGIARTRIALDPGLGFGKQRQHNLAVLAATSTFAALGYPVLVGASRKFSPPSGDPGVRLATSVVAALAAARLGARMLRVHDVAATAAALKVEAAINS